MAPERLNRRPPGGSWVAAVYLRGTDSVQGTGVVIAPTRVLTCAHVVKDGPGWHPGIEIAFPMANLPLQHRIPVARVRPDNWTRSAHPDLVVLELDVPVPTSVVPARVRFPDGNDLYDLDWWAFGFPHGERPGCDAGGSHGAYLGDGIIRLRRRWADELVQGFSGSGVWSYDYDAVVGLVVATGRGGDGQALTLHFADLHLPELKLREDQDWRLGDTDEQAHAAWGWRLAYDDERGRHWSPRARGVTADSDRGFHFRGRTRALNEIVDWLDRGSREAAVLVVTGSPGVGKSAVLGRIVTTADRDIQAQLPDGDTGVRATVGSVNCAVHVKGKTAYEAILEIARAGSLPLPATPEGLASILAERLGLVPERTAIVIDALDEATSPADARQIIATVLELVRTSAHNGLRVVVGTRKRDDEGDLLAAFDRYARILDLDQPEYFQAEDLTAYALSTLQLVGAERPANPYRDYAVAEPVARRIAQRSDRNFLIAGLVARDHGLHDTVAVDAEALDFSPEIDAILEQYVRRIPDVGPVPARQVLAVLAHAESPGLPVALWRVGVRALGGAVTEEQLAAFARTSAANFLIESGTEPAYRLFHQAFNDALLRAEPDREDTGRRLFEAYLAHGRAMGWEHAPPYLLRSLAGQAPSDGIDALLGDDEYVLRADLARLLRAADGRATTATGQARVTLLARTPQAVSAEPAERAAMLSVTQTMDRLDSAFGVPTSAPYVATWANTPPRQERAVLEGHTAGVYGICAVPRRDRTLLASAGEDGTVRLWDPVTGQTERVLDGHRGRVRSLCAIAGPATTLIAAGGDDATITLWNADTGRPAYRLTGHADWIRALCVVKYRGRPHLVSCGDDRTVRIWDHEIGSVVRIIGGQHGWITAAGPVETDQGPGLAWGSYAGQLTVWHLAADHPLRIIDAHTSWVTAVVGLGSDSAPEGAEGGRRHLIASGGYDGAVRIWDADLGTLVRQLAGEGRPVTGLCQVHDGGRRLLAATGEGGSLRVWPVDEDEAPVEPALEGHTSWVTAVCAVPVGGGQELIASGSEDGTVRLWAPGTGEFGAVLAGDQIGPVAALCPLAGPEDGSPTRVAAALPDGSVGVWDAATGAAGARWRGHFGPVLAVCPATVDGRTLASVGTDSKIHLRDARTGAFMSTLSTERDSVSVLAPLVLDDIPMLVTGGDDHAVRLWRLPGGVVTRRFVGHTGWVRAVAVVPHPRGPLLLSGSYDGTARVWDPYTADPVRVLSGHYGAVTAVTSIPDGDRLLLATGGTDHIIRLWDLETGSVALTLTGHTGGVAGLELLRIGDATRLVSAGADRTLRVWDVETGSLLLTVPVHSEAMACRTIDGKLVVGLATGLLVLDFGPRGHPPDRG